MEGGHIIFSVTILTHKILHKIYIFFIKYIFKVLNLLSLSFSEYHLLKIYVFNRLLKKIIKGIWGDFPSGPVAKTLCSQCREPGFDPWLGN